MFARRALFKWTALPLGQDKLRHQLDDAACLSVGDSAIYLDGVMVLIDHHVVAERSEFGSDLGGQLGFRFASFFD